LTRSSCVVASVQSAFPWEEGKEEEEEEEEEGEEEEEEEKESVFASRIRCDTIEERRSLGSQ